MLAILRRALTPPQPSFRFPHYHGKNRCIRRRMWGLAGLLLALLAAPPTHAQTPQYTVTDLGTLGERAPYSDSGYGINNSGQVTGESATSSNNAHAFLYFSGQMTDLGTLPGGSQSYGYGINDSGQVTGQSETSGGGSHAFLYSNGSMTDLGALPGGGFSTGYAVNDSGQVVGHSDLTGTTFGHGFLYFNGQMTDLGTLPGGSYSSATGINAGGQITGYADTSQGRTHAFLYSNGAMTDLGVPPGDISSDGYAINNSGQVTGIASGSLNGTYFEHAFLYSSGAMTDLGALPGFPFTYGWGINVSGQVVGEAATSGSGSALEHAFLDSGGQMTDLNTLLPPGSGWVLESAQAISDNGSITGRGINPQNQQHAFLLTPITAGPARFDFNGDGHPDLLWRNSQSGQVVTWDMNDQTVAAYNAPFATVSPQWTIAAVADVNADGHPDLLWENTQTGQLLFWLMGGSEGNTVTTYGSVFATVSDTHWHVASMNDFNGDGKPDLLWENSQTGQLTIWYMSGTTVQSYGQPFATVASPAWRVAGTADFNGDGKPDLLWENTQTGQVLVWYMNGTQVLVYDAPFATVTDTHWHVVGTGDFNRDGHPDLLWANSRTGQVLRWRMNGTTITQTGAPFATVTDTHWQIVGVH